MRMKGLKYPALCEPELEEIMNDLDATQRREMARKFDRWSAQLDFSADFLDYFARPDEAETGPALDDGLAELAARLENQAADIRATLGVPRKPKRAQVTLAFTGN